MVPTLCVGMPNWTLRVRFERDAERPGLHSHAERGNDRCVHSDNMSRNQPCRDDASQCRLFPAPPPSLN
ncbi:hypothetical protein PFAS1_08340 [Pseudomonas frederiksbergensis]|nr:hypothetical protein PFAS1_08340 [Pseudomonas frederiksbergensis]